MRRTWVRVAVAAIALSAFAVVLARANPARVVKAFGMMSWGWASAAALVNLLTVVADAARWRLVLSPVSQPSLLRTVQALLLGFTGNLVLPYKLGDGVRAVSLARWQGLPIATVAATVILDRVIDAATFAVWAAALTMALEMPGRQSLVRAGIVVVILATLAAVTWWARRRTGAGRTHGQEDAGGFTARVLDGLRVLREGRLLPAIGAFAALAWIGRAGVVWCMLQAFHLQLPLLATISTLIAINVGISVVAAPANVGVYEVSAAGALAAWGVPSVVGISCGLAMHAAEIVPVLLLGVTVIVTTGVRLAGPISSPATGQLTNTE